MDLGSESVLFDFLPEEIGAQVAVDDLDVFLKASFGGDRSEAGRYAANVRWQGNVKEAEKPRTRNLRVVQLKTSPDEKDFITEEPKGSSSNPMTQRLIDAQNNLKAKGYTVKKYENKQTTTRTVPSQATSADGDTVRFDDIQKQLAQIMFDDDNSRISAGASMAGQAVQYFRDNPNTSLFLVEKDGQVIGASVLKMPPDDDKAELVYSGSTATVKGTGSAMFADVIKTVAAADKRLFLKSVDDASDFWKSMGFNMVGSFGTMGVKKVSEMAKDLP